MNWAIFPSIQNQKQNQKDESFLVTKELSRPKLLFCLSNTNLLVISIIGMQKKQIASKKMIVKGFANYRTRSQDGLSIVKHTCRNYGIKIDVKSKEGVGFDFILAFPKES